MPTNPQALITYTTANGSQSATATISLLNPQPVVIAESPAAITTLSTPIKITGSGFVPSSSIAVNGTVIATNFVDSEHLTATVTAAGPGTSPLSVAVFNPDPGESWSDSVIVANDIAPLSVQPSVLSGGAVSLVINGSGFTPTSVVSLQGKELKTTYVNSSTLSATGYLTPWTTGTATVGVEANPGGSITESVSVPIAATAVPYDVAARFATQAAMGPRHDVVEHIQQIGLGAFIDEQVQVPPLTYTPGITPRHVMLQNAMTGNALLRERMSLAIQSFVVNQAFFITDAYIPWHRKMDADAFGNFRQVLEDAASDPNMAGFLNLNGNVAPSDPTQHPNQNFARELLQLFSIGPNLLNDDGTIQVDASGNPLPAYDQTTILELSRTLTGWWVPPATNDAYSYYGTDFSLDMVSVEGDHDQGQKVLFGSIVLPAGEGALADREAALDTIFNHPNVAPFVSRLLIQRLVKSAPSGAYVSRIAQVFKNDGNGVRGNLAAVARAILLDPEARAGDTVPEASDGFLQEPWLYQSFAMAILGMNPTDGQADYLSGLIGQNVDYPATVFGYYSPSYMIPGTTINSPEFGLLNNISDIQREQFLWSMIEGLSTGFNKNPLSYLYTTYTTVPEMVEALNHLLFHGLMTEQTKTTITNYCSGLNPNSSTPPLDTAIFLAMNASSNQVSH